MKPLSFFLFVLLSYAPVQGSTLILDSFTEFPFTLSSDPEVRAAPREPIVSDIADLRGAGYNPRSFGIGTLFATADTANGVFSYRLNATNQNTGPVSVGLVYQINQPFSLLGSTAFEFEISNFSGTGYLAVSLDTPARSDNITQRVDLHDGIIRVPFERLQIPDGFDPFADPFTSIEVGIYAETEVLELDLLEIRVVPEPSTALLALMALPLLARRRRGFSWS